MSSSNVVALVMAAGYSRRFGEDDKRCATLTDGRSLLAASVANAEQAFPILRVAIREEDDATLLGLAESTPLVRLHQAHLGLGASLADAMAALSHDARGGRDFIGRYALDSPEDAAVVTAASHSRHHRAALP